MENTPVSNDSLFNVGIDVSSREQLQGAATWAKIVAIISFISAGLTIVTEFVGDKSAIEKAGSLFLALIVAGISLAINIFLLRFATKVQGSLHTMNQEEFNQGVNGLRTYFKILGILLIIFLSLMVLFLLFLMIGVGMR